MNAKDLHIEHHVAQESPWLELAKRIVRSDIQRQAAIKEGHIMEFTVTSTAKGDLGVRQFSTLKGFLEWVKEQDTEVIVSMNSDPPSLEIYDAYRE